MSVGECEPVVCEMTKEDEVEDEKVKSFMRDGCGCNLNRGKPCFTLFEESHYRDSRNTFAELDHDSLDLVIKTQIMAHTRQSKEDGKKHHTSFYHLSFKVSTESILITYL